MSKPKTEKSNQRALFATRLGVIAATVGSSVGLGNIWRFPYEAGQNGGGAFMLCYLCFIILLGIPVICAEFVLGRKTRTDFFSCMQKLKAPALWRYSGLIGIIASLMILSFYSVVAGWTLYYLVQSVTGSLDLGANAVAYTRAFAGFSTGVATPLACTLSFLAINFMVVLGGVQKGIERVSNILMPLLFVMLLAMCINSLTMSGAKQGLQFLFSPDFSVLSPSIVVSAMGQAFFSLSLGLGCMLTYASYFSDKTPLMRTAFTIAGLDTLVAILAGVLIFPAVFTYGMHPESGPALVFEVFPAIFHSMPGGALWAVVFFAMLFVASLTSTISMSEISIAFMCDKLKWPRKRSCIVSSLIGAVGGIACTLSFSGLSDIDFGFFTFDFFNFCNNVSSNLLLPAGGLLIATFVGWILPFDILQQQMTNGSTLRYVPVKSLRFLLRYVCPTGIAVIFASLI